jgi:hypothetical protein
MMKNIPKIMILTLVFYIYITNAFAELQTPNQEPNKPAYLKPISPDELKEDLDFLFKTIEEVHPNMYAYTSKEEFEPMQDELYRQIKRPISQLDFYKLLAPVVASLKDGHTFAWPFVEQYKEYLAGGGQPLPLAFRVDESELVITDNYGQGELPVSSTALKLAQQAASDFVYGVSRRFPAHGRDRNPGILERAELVPLILWIEYGPVNSLLIKIRTPAGQVRNHTVRSMARNEMQAKIVQKKGNTYRLLKEKETGLIELNDWSDDPGEFDGFLRTTFEQLHEDSVRSLVLDLRQNPGGDARRVKALMDYLTDQPYKLFEQRKVKLSAQCRFYREEVGPSVYEKRIGSVVALDPPPVQPSKKESPFRGQVFVLIGARSTSASTAFAAAVQYYEIGTLVGDETGDTKRIFGGCFPVILPHSRLRIHVSTESLIMAGGSYDSGPLRPGYVVRQNAADTVKGIDTVLQFTLNLIKNSEVKK